MSRSKFQQELKRSTDRFVTDLGGLIRQAAEEAVRDALRERLEATTASTASSDPERSAELRSRAARHVRAVRKAGGKRTKRTQQELEALTDIVLDYIEKNPGQRVEEIGRGLGVSTGDLTVPMRNLVRENHLRTIGENHKTVYFAR